MHTIKYTLSVYIKECSFQEKRSARHAEGLKIRAWGAQIGVNYFTVLAWLCVKKINTFLGREYKGHECLQATEEWECLALSTLVQGL